MSSGERGGTVIERLREADRLLAGIAPDSDALAALDSLEVHRAHGVAGRIQDRVISILTRLTMEMVSREDGSCAGSPAEPADGRSGE
jgi:hypothetical protein